MFFLSNQNWLIKFILQCLIQSEAAYSVCPILINPINPSKDICCFLHAVLIIFEVSPKQDIPQQTNIVLIIILLYLNTHTVNGIPVALSNRGTFKNVPSAT